MTGVVSLLSTPRFYLVVGNSVHGKGFLSETNATDVVFVLLCLKVTTENISQSVLIAI